MIGHTGPIAALHCRANLGAYRWEGQRPLLGEDLLSDLEALPNRGLLVLVLPLCGILHVVAPPQVGGVHGVQVVSTLQVWGVLLIVATPKVLPCFFPLSGTAPLSFYLVTGFWSLLGKPLVRLGLAVDTTCEKIRTAEVPA